MFSIQRTNTILYCKQWAETVAFYRDVLGLRVTYETDWFMEFQLAENSYLSVANEQRATVKSAAGAGITLSWQVDDVQQAYDNLQEKEITVSPLKQKWGARVCYFHDPEGNRIELWQTTS